MNVMFLNSLEKAAGDGRVLMAQVSIGEDQGTWHVMWSELKDNGHSHQETWYEGLHWEEMLNVFRENVFTKQCEGYKPLVDMKVSELSELDERGMFVQMLHYYSELHADEAIYEALRVWRLKQANQEGKAAFIVANNRLLRMISAFLPQTEEELKTIPGMGKTKIEKYGASIISITAAYPRTTSFPLTWVEGQVSHADLNAWLLKEKDRRRQMESEKQGQKRKLLEAIADGAGLDELGKLVQVQRRELLGLIEELESEGYDLEPFLEQTLGQVPAAERELAWQAFEQQGDRYLKPIMQKVYNAENMPKETERAYEWLRMLRLLFRRNVRLNTVEAG